MKIVVAGGTGFVGRHITRALLDSEHDVTVLTRNPAAADKVQELAGAGAVRGDVTDPESLSGSLDGADVVVGAVAFPNFPMELPRKGLTFYRYDFQGTENLIAEAKSAGVGRYVYVSGAGADPTSTRTWYRAKGLAERALRESGLSFAFLRPSWAYGPGDKALNRIAAMVRYSPVVPRLGLQPQWIQPVFIEDIGLAVSRIVGSADAWDRVFEIGGPDVMTMDEVMRTLFEVMGKKRMVLPVPIPLAKLATAPLIVLPKPPMTPTGVEFATQDGLADTTELTKVLDVTPIALREGLSRYLRAAKVSSSCSTTSRHDSTTSSRGFARAAGSARSRSKRS